MLIADLDRGVQPVNSEHAETVGGLHRRGCPTPKVAALGGTVIFSDSYSHRNNPTVKNSPSELPSRVQRMFAGDPHADVRV